MVPCAERKRDAKSAVSVDAEGVTQNVVIGSPPVTFCARSLIARAWSSVKSGVRSTTCAARVARKKGAIQRQETAAADRSHLVDENEHSGTCAR